METISFYGKFWNELIKMKKKRILSGLQPSGKITYWKLFWNDEEDDKISG